MCTDPEKLKQRYQAFFMEHQCHFRACNASGKWPSVDFDRHRQEKIELDAMAKLLELSPAERQTLESNGVH